MNNKGNEKGLQQSKGTREVFIVVKKTKASEKQRIARQGDAQTAAMAGHYMGLAGYCAWWHSSITTPSVHLAASRRRSSLAGRCRRFCRPSPFGLLGLAAWLLPWLFCTAAFLLATETDRSEKIRKFSSIGIIILAISILASLMDSASADPIDPQVYEHGRGGSLGEVLYDGVLSKSLGGLGTGLLMAFAGRRPLSSPSIRPAHAFAGLADLGRACGNAFQRE